MAQNFRRYIARNTGTSAVTILTSASYDTIIGINLANTTGSAINVSCYVTSSGNDYYICKSTNIPQYSTLSLIDSGKFVLQSGDVLKVVSDTATSLDTWVSCVNDISS
jgi:hypothetical protein